MGGLGGLRKEKISHRFRGLSGFFLKHEGHEEHEERIKDRLYPAEAQRKDERKLNW